MTRLKLAGALVLAASILLPQYTCARLRAPDGSVVDEIPLGADSSAYHRYDQPHYALEMFGPLRWETWVTVTTFTWPLLFLALRTRRRWRRLNSVLWWCEPLLLAVSGYLILAFSDMGERAYGAWVGLCAIGVLLVVWVWELWVWIRSRRAARAATVP